MFIGVSVFSLKSKFLLYYEANYPKKIRKIFPKKKWPH